jgi:hypothetical protein
MKFKLRKTQTLFLLVALLSIGLFGYACDSPGGCGTDPPAECSDYDTCRKGSYATTQSLTAGPNRDSGLFYPTSGNGPFPILVFGCGAGTNPDSYVDHGNHIASWGFVVMIETSTSSGTELVEAMDWLQTQNADSRSVLYQKCNLSKIAAGGHSRGSMGTFRIAGDPRLTTTIHVAGGIGNAEIVRGLKKPAAYICGSEDPITAQSETDYPNTTVPVFFTIMDGVDHIMAARSGLPAICAWMLWHLKGETNRAADFLQPNGKFQTGMWDSRSKNW